MEVLKKSLKMGFSILLIILAGCFSNNDWEKARIREGVTNIQIVSHRGANRLAPENTYASALNAIENGAAYIEVDVRKSKDGIYYVLHDESLERTTNGIGLINETHSSIIDTLDAGGWFAHKYEGERIPRLSEYLHWIKGKAKVYFDVKDADLNELIRIIYDAGLSQDCFFWFSDWNMAKKFRALFPDLPLKVNAYSISAVDSLYDLYYPQIIETSLENLSDEFILHCHNKGLKIMPWIAGNDWSGYQLAMRKNIDMINLDNPDVFTNMVKNSGFFKGYKLIAHRGGIVEGKYNEFDPASIQEAIDQGYYMLEVDVQETKDGVLILNHDNTFFRFYNNPRQVNEMTWEEVKKLRPLNGKDYHPLSFEELAKMCSGKIQLMIDVKRNSPPEFYYKLGNIMRKYDLMKDAYFIDYDARKYFWGEAKFSIQDKEIEDIKSKFWEGEDVACHYFLFDAGTRLTSSVIKMCQKANITVVPSVNFGHYHFEDAGRGAKRDIEFLKACGVTEFQIDSDFDDWLPAK